MVKSWHTHILQFDRQCPNFIRNVDFFTPTVFNSACLLLSLGSTTILSTRAHLSGLRHPSRAGACFIPLDLGNMPYLPTAAAFRVKVKNLCAGHYRCLRLCPLLDLGPWSSHLTSQYFNVCICVIIVPHHKVLEGIKWEYIKDLGQHPKPIKYSTNVSHHYYCYHHCSWSHSIP